MKTIRLLLATMSILSQGCASLGRSNFGEFVSDRPTVTDALRGGQTAVPSFAGNRSVPQLPSSLPIPVEADPVARLRVPDLVGSRAVIGYRAVSDAYQFLSCVGLYGTSDCDKRADLAFRLAVKAPPAQKGPVILR
jgi:hypothetical protein